MKEAFSAHKTYTSCKGREGSYRSKHRQVCSNPRKERNSGNDGGRHGRNKEGDGGDNDDTDDEPDDSDDGTNKKRRGHDDTDSGKEDESIDGEDDE